MSQNITILVHVLQGVVAAQIITGVGDCSYYFVSQRRKKFQHRLLFITIVSKQCKINNFEQHLLSPPNLNIRYVC